MILKKSEIRKIILLLFLVLINSSCNRYKKSIIMKWLCYYGNDTVVEKLNEYDLVILEPDNIKDASKIKSEYKLAYLSVGEINKSRFYYEFFKDRKWLGAENPNWPGSFKANIRNTEWRNYIVERIIPNIVGRGYNGIFLDTVNEAVSDTDGIYTVESGKQYIELLKKIRKAYPRLFILQNSGIETLKEAANQIDGILFEDLFTNYDFSKKIYKIETNDFLLNKINEIKKVFNKPIFVIDYCESSDLEMRGKLRKKAENTNVYYYLAEIELDKIYE